MEGFRAKIITVESRIRKTRTSEIKADFNSFLGKIKSELLFALK
jgi:hypothetical protein